jgi:glycosyltransferase involved in cell wall biosynthesis
LIRLNVPGITRIGTEHGLRGLETPIDHFFWKYKNTLRERVKYVCTECFSKAWKNHQYHKSSGLIYSGIELVTVSNHSHSSLRSYFPQYNKEVPVFFSPNTSSTTPAVKRGGVEPYFLMVSGNRWEKNNLRAIMAFDRLVSNGQVKGMKAVITGCSPKNFRYKIQNPDHFIFHGYVEENVLEDLYANAYAFVYPSLNEGFGYPPLEAMRYGVPVIASPFSSISDVLEGSALYFNPFSVEEIMSRMLLILDKERHRDYAQRGLERYAFIKHRQDADLDAIIDYIIS